MTVKKSFIIRFVVFVVGLFVMGLGVALTKTGGLGVSPVSSIPNIMSIKFPVLTIGNWLIIANCCLILGQVLVLRRDFKIWQLLQIPLSFLFGYFTDFGMWICSFIPSGIYWIQVLDVIFGTAVLAFGVFMMVQANLIMNSGEAFVKAVSEKSPLEFSTLKIIFDVTFVATSILLSLIFFKGKVLGTREGTIFAAVMVGVFVKLYTRVYKKIKAKKNPAPEYKAVFADLDRTLLNSDRTISDFTKETIEKLLAKGIDFVPCSGRSIRSFPEELFSVKGIKHSVSSNGVSVDDMQKRESLEYLVLPESIPAKVLDFLKDEDIYYECFINGQGYTEKKYYDDPLAFDEVTFPVDYVKTTRLAADSMVSFVLEHKAEIGSLEVIVHPKDCDRILSSLKEKFPEVYITKSERFLMEISNINCGKHHGLERYCRMMGIEPAQVIAFGDGPNDTEMLQAAGLGIAVGNAFDECKKIAARVVETNNEDGVAKEIIRIFGL
ncbi:MAG: Cof-type HAD-IIB family hydrolase [Treponema sp.]|nr:Cof-type HAD-IIB family hydrolase [Treponema sp.]